MPHTGLSRDGFRFRGERFTFWTPEPVLSYREAMMRDVNELTGKIVDIAYRLHSRIGPGLLESVYETILAHALEKQGMGVERQKPIPFEWDGMRIEEACRLDLLVEGQVVVELKSTEKLIPAHQKQVLTYLRLLDLPVGLLINFGAASLKDGMQRIINPHASEAPPVLDPRLRPAALRAEIIGPAASKLR